MKYSAAIDLGGTNIGIGIVSEEGQIHPTDKARGSKKANATIWKCMKKEH